MPFHIWKELKVELKIQQFPKHLPLELVVTVRGQGHPPGNSGNVNVLIEYYSTILVNHVLQKHIGKCP